MVAQGAFLFDSQDEMLMEAPSGIEPLNRSFADCSLSHLGTAPARHYNEAPEP